LKNKKRLNFFSNNNEVHNKDFEFQEVNDAIKMTKCTTPGPDEIHNSMLKNLPEVGVRILLLALNRIWKKKLSTFRLSGGSQQ